MRPTIASLASDHEALLATVTAVDDAVAGYRRGAVDLIEVTARLDQLAAQLAEHLSGEEVALAPVLSVLTRWP